MQLMMKLGNIAVELFHFQVSQGNVVTHSGEMEVFIMGTFEFSSEIFLK